MVVAGLALTFCAAFAAGCTVGERPTLTQDAIDRDDGGLVEDNAQAGFVPSDGLGPSTEGTLEEAGDVSNGETTTAAGEPISPLDDLDALGDAPPVLLTPTGVVVPVLRRAVDGYVVNSPCGNEAVLTWGQPIEPVDVVLDPGHGGDEPGAISATGQTESEVNLDVARRTAVLLEQRGYAVALTRTADYRVTIPNRAAIADRLEARALVSIHHNSPNPELSEARSEPGTEVYPKAASPDSQRLAGLLYGSVVAAISQFDAEWASRDDAGVLTVINESGEDAYGIVRRPDVPTALVELAYLSNPTEDLVIGTDDYRATAAASLADGILRYLETAEEGTGFVDEPRLFNPSGDTGGSAGCVDPSLE